MRKNFGTQTWVLPQPVLILGTYDKDGNADAMNAAWGGVYDEGKIIISLSPHRTTENIKLQKAFTVSFGDTKNLVAADYVGIVSANEEPEKMQKAGLHTHRAEKVNAPVIEEFPVTLECTLERFTEDGNVVGKIVNVSAEESVLNEKGKIDLGKLDLIIFDPVTAGYRRIGERVGNAFSDGKRLR